MKKTKLILNRPLFPNRYSTISSLYPKFFAVFSSQFTKNSPIDLIYHNLNFSDNGNKFKLINYFIINFNILLYINLYMYFASDILFE